MHSPSAIEISTGWVHLDNTRKQFGFSVASYDESKILYVDPQLEYLTHSTYFGGSNGPDSKVRIYLDESNNIVYAAGEIRGVPFTATPGSAGADISDSSWHYGVAKFDMNLGSLIAMTYYGGSGPDNVSHVVYDTSGAIN